MVNGSNLYLYTANNPVNNIDPFGLMLTAFSSQLSGWWWGSGSSSSGGSSGSISKAITKTKSIATSIGTSISRKVTSVKKTITPPRRSTSGGSVGQKSRGCSTQATKMDRQKKSTSLPGTGMIKWGAGIAIGGAALVLFAPVILPAAAVTVATTVGVVAIGGGFATLTTGAVRAGRALRVAQQKRSLEWGKY